VLPAGLLLLLLLLLLRRALDAVHAAPSKGELLPADLLAQYGLPGSQPPSQPGLLSNLRCCCCCCCCCRALDAVHAAPSQGELLPANLLLLLLLLQSARCRARVTLPRGAAAS
jgi:hypothetical protein